jgi:hypothetical protein
VSTGTIIVSVVGGWLSACLLVLTCVAPRLPAGVPSTSLGAVDRMLEHSRAAAAALAALARAANADPADLLADARCQSGRARQLLAPVAAEFGLESDVGRSATKLLASIQAALTALELALAQRDDRIAATPWVLVDPPLTTIRLAQDRLVNDVWRTLERRRGGGEAPALPRSTPNPG